MQLTLDIIYFMNLAGFSATLGHSLAFFRIFSMFYVSLFL